MLTLIGEKMGILVDSTGRLFHPLFPGRIGIWKCWLLWREENRSTRRKTLGAGTRTNNKLNPHMTPRPGIERRPHWWEASALTTAPSLLPLLSFSKKILSNSVEGTTSKSMVLPWPLLLQTFLWPTLKPLTIQSIVKPSVWKC